MTELQEKIIALYQEVGNYHEVARKLGKNPGSIHKVIRLWQEQQLRAGEVPDGYKISEFVTRTDKEGETSGQTQRVKKDGGDRDDFVHVPNPRSIKFTTTTFDGSGRVERQWVREQADLEEREKLWKAYAEELIRPLDTTLCEPIAPISHAAQDFCAVYPIGDYHIGMMAWGLETRSDNYDIKIAEQLLAHSCAHLMQGAPASEQCVLAFMGDFVHFDSFRPETPAHKHLLDADTRFGKVGRVAVRIIRHIIAAARKYHKNVHVVFLRGNHDPAVAELINIFLGEMYEDVPNVTVDLSPSYFRYYEWGKNLWMFAHGDKTKPDNMPMIMASHQPEAWGRTTQRVVFTGHVHHESRKDIRGVAVEKVPVIIPNDAYAADAGYHSRRAMQVVIFDREFGEDQRHTFNPERFYRTERLK